MTRSPLLLVPFAALALPSAALANDKTSTSFEHDGSRYTYTVTETGTRRTIRGIEEKSGKRFVLHVDDKRVKGYVDDRRVQFRLSEVEPVIQNAMLADH